MGIKEGKQTAPSCRSCGWWERTQAMDAAGRIRRDRVARCLWESTEPYPVSVVTSYFGASGRPKGGYTAADDGANCACFKPAAAAP